MSHLSLSLTHTHTHTIHSCVFAASHHGFETVPYVVVQPMHVDRVSYPNACSHAYVALWLDVMSVRLMCGVICVARNNALATDGSNAVSTYCDAVLQGRAQQGVTDIQSE